MAAFLFSALYGWAIWVCRLAPSGLTKIVTQAHTTPFLALYPDLLIPDRLECCQLAYLPDFLLDICHVFRKLTAFYTTDSNTIYKENK